MNGSGLVCLKRCPLEYQATSQRYHSLTRYGVLPGGPYISLLLVGPFMDNTRKNLEQRKSSAVWASDKESCSEAPEGATGQDSATPITGGTPLIEEEHLSDSRTAGNLEKLTENVGSLGLQFPKKNRCGAARKRARKARWLEAHTGATAGGQPQTTSGDQLPNVQGPSTSAASDGGSVIVGQEPRRTRDIPKHKNDSGRPVVLRVAGRLRGPNRLGNLAMLELPRRASGWLLYVKITLEFRSLGIIL
jgi:hypothetical protein